MAIYTIAIIPFIFIIVDITRQDDSSTKQQLTQMTSKLLARSNPKFSHYPEVRKSWPVIKKNQHQQYATDIFYETSVQITTDGPRHLGAVKKTLKKLYSLFLWMGFNCFKATEPLQGGSLLRSIEYKRTYIQEKTGQ